MLTESDIQVFNKIIARYQISQKTSSLIRQALDRINSIDESKTFRYEPLAEFEKRVPQLDMLKESASKSFAPFAQRYHTSLCAAMGVPMSESITSSKKNGNYEAIYELFGLTNAKAKKFGLAALYCSLDGQKNEISDMYNIVFDRDSPWTYRNEAEHMEEYARYHFNSYMISHIENTASNPFVPVIELYEFGSADFIFMQTESDGIKKERLATFHTVNIPDKGNVIGIHMTGDQTLLHYRKWGDPYFRITSIKENIRLKITGIADQRFRAD